MQSLSSKWHGNYLPEELASSWEPLCRADCECIFCCILTGNKQASSAASSYTTYPHERDRIPQKSNKRHHLLVKLGVCGISCKFWKTHNEDRLFHNVSALHMKLQSRLFVSLRMSFQKGQSRHETRKRDVVSARCWAGLQPMRNRFLLTQLSVWTVFSVIMLGHRGHLQQTQENWEISDKSCKTERLH